MTEEIEKVFDDVNDMVNDCIQKIEELETLENAYQILGKCEEHGNDPDNAVIETNRFVEGLRQGTYGLPIRGVFGLATEFKQIYQIDNQIKYYTDIKNEWIKIRDQLGAN